MTNFEIFGGAVRVALYVAAGLTFYLFFPPPDISNIPLSALTLGQIGAGISPIFIFIWLGWRIFHPDPENDYESLGKIGLGIICLGFITAIIMAGR